MVVPTDTTRCRVILHALALKTQLRATFKMESPHSRHSLRVDASTKQSQLWLTRGRELPDPNATL